MIVTSNEKPAFGEAGESLDKIGDLNPNDSKNGIFQKDSPNEVLLRPLEKGDSEWLKTRKEAIKQEFGGRWRGSFKGREDYDPLLQCWAIPIDKVGAFQEYAKRNGMTERGIRLEFRHNPDRAKTSKQRRIEKIFKRALDSDSKLMRFDEQRMGQRYELERNQDELVADGIIDEDAKQAKLDEFDGETKNNRKFLEKEDVRDASTLKAELTGFEGKVLDKSFFIPKGRTDLAAKRGREILSDVIHGVFQRDGKAVVIVRHINQRKRGAEDKKKMDRPDGSPIIKRITEVSLIEKLSEIQSWTKYDARAQGNTLTDFPMLAAKMIIEFPGETIPYLSGIISAPTLRNDGSILEKRGYDKDSGLVFYDSGIQFPSIPHNPTKEEALAALKILQEPIEEYAFAGDSSEERELNQSTALAMILIAILRRSMRFAPLLAIDATNMASGKTKLARIGSLIANGIECTIVPPARDEDEVRKRVSSAMLAGDSCLCLDNVDFPMESAFLCSALTCTEVSERNLGKSENNKIPTNITLFITGNDLVVRGDLTSRTIVCRIDPKIEHPDERTFKCPNLEMFVQENRGKLVSAALTIVRAYFVAGCPAQNIPPARDFIDFDRMVRSPLVWLGLPDPYQTTRTAKENDPAREQLGSLFFAWYKVPAESLSIKQLLEIVNNPRRREENDDIQALYDQLLEFAPDGKGGISANKLGNTLREHKGRIVNGYRLVSPGKDGRGAVIWKIAKV